ncbi:Chlororespiratory reduction 21 [Heracleum sosnowskyi]|uniref:Chlororespiratory reduction 21 n=1 Tax=Heracleum sosnowskyi TaxID=360622 RepID=A0AAD8N2L0_9APIA|nr:Chlororespiratory reduction 21 [Heracleum sosnowskyi]
MASLYIPTPLYVFNHHFLNPKFSTKFQENKSRISPRCKATQLQETLQCLSNVGPSNLLNKPQIYGDILQECVYQRDFLLGLYCRLGYCDEALLGFCEMLKDGVLGDNFVLPNVLKACGALMLIGFGKGVHGYVVKLGFQDCVFVASSLVDMYGKCGCIDDAWIVFDGMVERNVVTWNSMISSCVQNGFNEEAIGIFYDMRVEGFEPTRVTMVGFLSASANVCGVEEGKQAHGIALLSGMDLDDILGTSIINFYSKVGLVDDAELVFSRMLKKDVVTWNLLISCYVQYGQTERGIRLCQLMRLENFKYDSVTLASILSASAELKSLKLGREAHCYCIKNDLVNDVVVVSSIVNMYAKCERINVARKVFDFTKKRDLALWNTILAAYAEIGISGETLSLFYQMQLEGVPPNVISWNLVILSLISNERVNEAMDMFTEMRYLGIMPNLITYTTVITGLARNGLGNEAIMQFSKMLEEGIQPNIVSIIGVLSACELTPSLRCGKAVHSYIYRHNVLLTVPLATSLVDMYAKCGNLEALALFKHMLEGIEPDSITCGGVLSACSHAGLLKEGLEIFTDMVLEYNVERKYLTNLEPNNLGNYVALSNAYGATGMWKEMSVKASYEREGPD